jgi:hypothetical protein
MVAILFPTNMFYSCVRTVIRVSTFIIKDTVPVVLDLVDTEENSFVEREVVMIITSLVCRSHSQRGGSLPPSNVSSLW